MSPKIEGASPDALTAPLKRSDTPKRWKEAYTDPFASIAGLVQSAEPDLASRADQIYDEP